MTLQQQASTIVSDPREYFHLLIGDPGVGKTTWASQIMGHYFAMSELGVKGVSVFGHPVVEWQDFLNLCGDLIEAKQNDWKDAEGKPMRVVTTLVIDTYEKLHAAAGRWICANRTFAEKGIPQKFARIEDVPYGKGYKAVNELIIEKLNKIMLYGFGAIAISHMKERIVKWRGQEMKAIGPNLPPSAADAIVGAVDAVGYFTIDQSTTRNTEGVVESVEEGRFSFWQPQFLTPTKHRLPGFPAKIKLNRDTMYSDYQLIFRETADKAIAAQKVAPKVES